MRRRIWLGAAGLIALVVVATASAAQSSVLTYSSTFDSSSEGWVAQEPHGSVVIPTWASVGGNPGGYISSAFSIGDGLVESSPGNPGSAWPKGNAVDDYGGTLGADFRVHLASASGSEVVDIGFVSSNSGAEPCGGVIYNPGSGWITDMVTLAGKHLDDCQAVGVLNAAQVNAALAGFDAVFVFAGNADSVSETVDVDNAELKGPQVVGSHPTGAIPRYFAFAHKAGTFHGWLGSYYDFSCVGHAQVTIFRKATTPVKVGTTRTRAANKHGLATFTFTLKTIVKGSYYASAAKVKSSLDGNTCNAAKSTSVTIP
jgi:hypothetical protein